MVCRVDEMYEESESMTADLRPRPPSTARRCAWLMAVLKVSDSRRTDADCDLRSGERSGLERR